jgi:hypothetical protein
MQALGRGFLVRKGAINLNSDEARANAIIIQAAVRGWTTRLRVRRLREAIHDHITRTHAAIRIQTIFRGRRGRQMAKDANLQRSSIIIQKHVKGRLDRKKIVANKAAATTISATYKGSRFATF